VLTAMLHVSPDVCAAVLACPSLLDALRGVLVNAPAVSSESADGGADGSTAARAAAAGGASEAAALQVQALTVVRLMAAAGASVATALQDAGLADFARTVRSSRTATWLRTQRPALT